MEGFDSPRRRRQARRLGSICHRDESSDAPNTIRVIIANVVDGESHDRVAQVIHRVWVTGGKVDRKLANPDFSKQVSSLACSVLAVLDAEDFNRDLDGLGS